ncbi:MAG TPA: adenylate/guanylate cyclase domain-containing protein [Verrucomicrobiae bacterium]|nr:adenylate/guanylate cyclase domain-containing protein [Verrucomicrobiae bacterium]
MSDSITSSPMPEQFRAALGLEEGVTLSDGLAMAEERLRDIISKQQKLPERHPSHPKLKKDRERIEPVIADLHEMVFGLKVDELCDAAEAVLSEKPPRRAVARDLLKRARLDGVTLGADSVYIRRIQKLEIKLEAEPAPSAFSSKSNVAPVSVAPAPIIKTLPIENPFLQLESLIDEGTTCLLQAPPDLLRAETCYAAAEKDASGRIVPDKLKSRLLVFRSALDRARKEDLRAQVDRILKEVNAMLAGKSPELPQAKQKLIGASTLLERAPDPRLQHELESLMREVQQFAQHTERRHAESPRMKNVRVQLGTRVRFRCRHRDQESYREVRATEFLIGRGSQGGTACLELSDDLRVSRRHARVWTEGGFFWIEDLGSKFGTKLDGIEIKGAGRRPLNPLSKILLGDTMLVLMEDDTARTPFQPLVAQDASRTPPVHIDSSVDARGVKGEAAERLLQRQPWLLELHLEMAAQRNLSDLLSLILHRAIEAIATAERGAVLLRDRDKETLLLAAYVSDGEPPVSDSLARKAMKDAMAFMWRRGFDESAESVRRLHIESGIYAPMAWEGRMLGVICVDNPRSESAFNADDLRLMQVLAHYAAMAVANQLMRDELRQNAVMLERLLTTFSPILRNRIVNQAREGRLRPGGLRSEVTILFADLRGFTAATARRDADEVMELLNDYLPAFAQVVFKHDGIIDKFTGDGLLAVFGSPEPDPEQHRHALLAACEMQSVATRITERRTKAGAVACSLGIGLHSGDVLHGFLGGAEMLEFTVIGEAVNLANRFCNTAPPGAVLLSPQVFQHVFQHVRAEPVVVETKHEGKLNGYRVIELKHAPQAAT